MDDVDGVAEAGVEISDKRQARLFNNGAHHVEMLRHADETDIRKAIERGQFEARGPQPVEAGLFGEPRRKRTVRRHDTHKPGAHHFVAQHARRAGFLALCLAHCHCFGSE